MKFSMMRYLRGGGYKAEMEGGKERSHHRGNRGGENKGGRGAIATQ